MRKATRVSFGEQLLKYGDNEDIIVLDGDLASATKVETFGKMYPEKFIEVGIAEQNMLAMSVGLANQGFVPIASTFAIFATSRAHEIIRNGICYSNANVKIIGTHAGLSVGYDGGTHQAIEDIGLMNVLPNMQVIAPADDLETRQVLDYAIEHYGPVYIRLGRTKVNGVHATDYQFKIGKASRICHGNKMVVMTYGVMVDLVKQIIKENNLDIKLLNFASIKPIDQETIIESLKFNKIMVIEEHSKYGGLGSIVSQELIAHASFNFEHLAIDDKFGESGAPDDVLKKHHLDKESVSKRILNMYNS